MVTFLVSLVALVIGYLFYGKFVEKIFAPDAERVTPAISQNDGVDFLPLPTWKIFMIQFLNIAGTGPIFGAILGAKFGPAAYLWIVLGCIFAGAVHDYLSGMLSIRNKGAGLPELIGIYLGNGTKKVMLVFTVFLMVMVGAVFVYSPALILGDMTDKFITGSSEIANKEAVSTVYYWCAAIFIYYIIATMLPVDKIIGKIYPFFAFAILFMAVALGANLLIKWPSLPELYDVGISTASFNGKDIFPALFITIACGAISGFHATQSPLMARCMTNEKHGRAIFYGSMITAVSQGWLGTIGSFLAIMGVVAAPITSGDTALRSARLIIAEFLHMEQKSISKRLYICIPMFAVTIALLFFNISNPDGFNVIWNYFGWANQTLSVFTLWAITVYLYSKKKFFYITLLPALFMTCVSSTFFCFSFGLAQTICYGIGAICTIITFVLFILWTRRKETK